METKESLEWCKDQSVVRVSCVKDGEDDKFIFTIGPYNISPLIFDTQEDAEEYLKENFKLTNFDLAVIGAMCKRLNEIDPVKCKS